MEQFYSLEALSIVSIASVALGWVLRETFSSWREWPLEEDTVEEVSGLFTLKVPPKEPSVQTRNGSNETRTAYANLRSVRFDHRRPIDGPIIAKEKVKSSNLQTSKTSSQRNHAFADMPPLAELRLEADEIRLREKHADREQAARSLAEFMRSADPGSLGILEHYRDSIGGLHHLNEEAPSQSAHCNARMVGETGAKTSVEAERDALPSLKDLTPIDPRTFKFGPQGSLAKGENITPYQVQPSKPAETVI